ncbi:MAG: hypothetical protein U9R11_01835 [Chloroflexota bacterium]|nr:hypothetical protein [Chloroflexota bacterium]
MIFISKQILPVGVIIVPVSKLELLAPWVGRADYLVTYDPHFDCLGGEYRGFKIVDGLHFLYVVRGD